jgi:hypothetical protein
VASVSKPKESEDIKVIEHNNQILRERFPEKTESMRRSGVLYLWMWPASIFAFIFSFAHPIIGPILLMIFVTLLVRSGKKTKAIRNEMLLEIGLDETGALQGAAVNQVETEPGQPSLPQGSVQKRIRKY